MIKPFNISNHGTVIMFEPLTKAAQNWWDKNVNSDCQKIGFHSYVVEHRYAPDIVEGIKNAFKL